MTPAARAARAAWIAWWRAMRRWHRYRVSGLEHLDRGPVLIVGYHGRPIAHDLAILTVVLLDRLGYLPHPVIHGYFRENAALRAFVEGVGFVTGEGDDLRAALARGEHVIVTPGGTREGCRPATERYRVAWGDRTGYLRLALRYGLPLVPVAAWGTDDAYLGLNDGYAWGKRLGAPHRLPLWLGLGLGGPWPLALPLPVRFHQVIGEPITLEALDPDDPGPRLLDEHRRVVAAVQGLLDRARREAT